MDQLHRDGRFFAEQLSALKADTPLVTLHLRNGEKLMGALDQANSSEPMAVLRGTKGDVHYVSVHEIAAFTLHLGE